MCASRRGRLDRLCAGAAAGSGRQALRGLAAIGYGDAEIDLRLLAGLTFTLFGLPAFLDLEAAQRLREGAPPTKSGSMRPSACASRRNGCC